MNRDSLESYAPGYIASALDTIFLLIRAYSTLDLFKLRKRLRRVLRFVGLDEDGEALSEKAEHLVSYGALRNRLCHFMLFFRCSLFHEGRPWVLSRCQRQCNSGLRILRAVALREARSPEIVLEKLVAVDQISFAYTDIMEQYFNNLNLVIVTFHSLHNAVPRTAEKAMRTIAFRFQSALIACLCVFTASLRAKQMVLWRWLAVSRYYDFVSQVHVDCKSGRLRQSRHEIPAELIDPWYLFIDVARPYLESPLSIIGVDERIFRARNGSAARRQYITNCVAQRSVKVPQRVGPKLHTQLLRTVQATMGHSKRDASLNRVLADAHNHSTSMASSSYVRLPDGNGSYLRPAAQRMEEREGDTAVVDGFFQSLRNRK
jgi:hypothetical protein